MSWLSARQNVLSQNVANADTPGYSAVDLKPLDFEKVLKQSTEPAAFQGGLVVTDPHHIAIDAQHDVAVSRAPQPATAASIRRAIPSPLEEEMMKVADTQAQYQAATQYLRESHQHDAHRDRHSP